MMTMPHNVRGALPLTLTLASLCLTATVLRADYGVQDQLEPQPIDSTAIGERFGTSVAIDGDTIVVGAPRHDVGGLDAGAAFVYQRESLDTWRLQDSLIPSIAVENDAFGAHVAIRGSVAVVCSTSRTVNGVRPVGSCVVFENTGSSWNEVDLLEPATPTEYYGFGSAVAVTDGQRIAIGAEGAAGAESDTGAVFLYRRDGSHWTLEQTLFAVDGRRFDLFGTALDLTDSLLAVGAPGDNNDAGSSAGAVYIYELDGDVWQESVKLVPTTVGASDHLGAAIAVSGDRIVAGAPGTADTAQNAGAAYVIGRPQGTWTDVARLLDPEGRAADAAGTAVALAGDAVFVGAPTKPSSNDQIGRTLVYREDGQAWTLVDRVLAPNLQSGSDFGAAIGYDPANPGLIAVGAPLDATNGEDSGTVLVLELADTIWHEAARLDSIPTAAEALFGAAVASSGDLLAVGAPSLDHNGLTNPGAVFTHRRSGLRWELEQAVTASDAGENDRFGAAVAVTGARLVVGAWNADSARGSAYVFEHTDGSGWSQTARLVASDRTVGDGFGLSVANDGDLVVVSSRSGSRAYVFQLVGASWHEVEILEAYSSPSDNQPVGDVAIHGDTIALASQLDPDGSAVRVFERSQDQWTLSAILRNPTGTSGDFFASSVDLDGTLLVVGAPGVDDRSGMVWKYDRQPGGWSQPTAVVSSTALPGALFGIDLALTDDGLVIGASGSDDDAGDAVVLDRTGVSFSNPNLLQLTDRSPGDEFGLAVGFAGGLPTVGARRHDDSDRHAETGAVFSFAEIAPLEPDFEWRPSAPVAGATVSFVDQSIGVPTSWEWDFGNGTQSDRRDPSTVFSTPGSYDVTLRVANSFGTETVARTVVVTEPTLRAAFAWSPAFPTAGEATEFDDTSSGSVTTWLWDFGDGATATGATAQHVFAAPGSYPVQLTIGDGTSVASIVRTVVIGGAGSAGFAPDLSVPAVARLQGAGAFFTSRIDVFNAGDAPIDVDLVYTSRADITLPDRRTVITLPQRTLFEVTDPLGEWFGFSDADAAVGALRMKVIAPGEGDALLAQSVVIARNDDGSEYGQFFPAFATDRALPAGTRAFLASTVDATVTRVNFGAMALTDGTTLRVTPVDPIGTTLASPRQLILDAGESSQLNDLDRRFNLAGRSNYVVQVEVDAGSALVYGSVLDGNSSTPGTSDPTTILPAVDGSESITLLELGPIVGFDEFSGSASVTNLGATQASVTASFYPRAQAGVAAQASLELGPGATAGFVDLVGDLFDRTGVGTVVLTAPGATLAATGREFAILRDGDQVVGTAGQLIPGMADEEQLAAGHVYHLLGLRQLETQDGLERSHVAAFNPPGGTTAAITLALFDERTGQHEGSMQLIVAPGELVQRNNVIRAISGTADGAIKRLEVVTDTPVFLKGFRVNQDADPITIDALPDPVR